MAVVNESSVFEPLTVYCISNGRCSIGRIPAKQEYDEAAGTLRNLELTFLNTTLLVVLPNFIDLSQMLDKKADAAQLPTEPQTFIINS